MLSKLKAAKLLCINPSNLTVVEMSNIPSTHLRSLSQFSILGFCYDNAHKSALAISGNVIFGIAVIQFGDDYLPVEHAWVEKEGQYYDPTYELNTSIDSVVYYQMLSITPGQCLDIIAFNFDTHLAYRSVDFYLLRQLPQFKSYF